MLDVVAVGEAPTWAWVYEEQEGCVPWSLVYVVDGVSVDFNPVIVKRVEVGINPVRTTNVFLHLVSFLVLQLEPWMAPGLASIVVDRGVFRKTVSHSEERRSDAVTLRDRGGIDRLLIFRQTRLYSSHELSGVVVRFSGALGWTFD